MFAIQFLHIVCYPFTHSQDPKLKQIVMDILEAELAAAEHGVMPYAVTVHPHLVNAQSRIWTALLCRVPEVMHAIDRSGAWPPFPRKPSLDLSCQTRLGRLPSQAMCRKCGVQYCEHHTLSRHPCEIVPSCAVYRDRILLACITEVQSSPDGSAV